MDPDWRDKAACIGMAASLFIPPVPDDVDENARLPPADPAARKACSNCYWTHASVNMCLSFAVINDEHGLWGGVTLTAGHSRTLSREDVFRTLTPEAKRHVRKPPDGWYS